MNGILIQYTFTGDESEWEDTIGKFISQIDSDPLLKGKFSYIVSRAKGGSGRVHVG
jgi:hypothetical protein